MSSSKKTIRFIAAAFLVTTLSACLTVKTSAPRPEGSNGQPLSWGILSEPQDCIIFAEYRKTEVGFFVVAVSTKTTGELRVLESSGYSLPKEIWSMSEADMNQLQSIASNDLVRFVKIPDKHSPEDLAAARDACGIPMLGVMHADS